MAEYNGDYDIVANAQFSEYVNVGIYLDKRQKPSHTRDPREDEAGQLTLLPGEVWEVEVIAEQVPDKFGVSIYSSIQGNGVIELVEENKMVSRGSTSSVNTWEDIEIVPNKKRFIVRVVNAWSYMNGDGVRRLTLKNPYVKIGDATYSPNEWLVSWELKEGSAGGSGGDEDIRVEDMAIRMGVGWDEVMIESGWEGGTIYLGPEGEEVALPEINWAEGSEGELEVEYGKKINMVDVINGGRRAWVREKSLRRWRFGWEDLSVEELELIKGYYESGEELRLKTNRDDEEWRRVVMSELQVSSKEERIARGEYRFRVTIELEEIAEED